MVKGSKHFYKRTYCSFFAVSIVSEASSVSVIVNSVDIFSAINLCAALKNVTAMGVPFKL